MNKEIRDCDIIDQCKSWVKNYIGEDFQFRKFQLEAIVSVIKNFLFNTKIQVMEAPTGSGKTFIAIVSAGVLWEYYKKKSYILASDLSLYKQYVDAFKKYNLPWGMLKGIGNYMCHRNGHTVDTGNCKINMVPIDVLLDEKKNENYVCAESCPYVQDYKLACAAPVTLLTYALYFIKIHQSLASGGTNVKYQLPIRDFVICDEAHNLPSLVQNSFSPSFDTAEMQPIMLINEFAKNRGDTLTSTNAIEKIINTGMFVDSKDSLYAFSKQLEKIYTAYSEYTHDIVKPAVKESSTKREDIKYVHAGNAITDELSKIRVFNSLVATYGTDTIVKSVLKTQTGFKLNCAYEDKLIYEFFHKRAKNELLMSATIGDVDIYKSIIGADNYNEDQFMPIEVPNTFDFTSAPIYYSTKYRMSYREKAASLPYVIKEVIDICNKHKGQRGLIHTGSYDISTALFKKLPPDVRYRIIPYSDSQDKATAISRYTKSIDGILIGPSLLEGLDFAGDLCRFNIFMKMPYASLADNLVKAKMDLFPNWYTLDVCARLAQGIGRAVRFPTDWADSYILDGCFTDILYNKDRKKNLSESFISRLIELK